MSRAAYVSVLPGQPQQVHPLGCQSVSTVATHARNSQWTTPRALNSHLAVPLASEATVRRKCLGCGSLRRLARTFKPATRWTSRFSYVIRSEAFGDNTIRIEHPSASTNNEDIGRPQAISSSEITLKEEVHVEKTQATVEKPPAKDGINWTRDIALLFATRSLRMFSFGLVSVVLVLFLKQVSFTGREIGALFSMTLAGDALFSLGITSVADRLGRRKMMSVGGLMMLGAGLVFALSSKNLTLLTLAAIFGVISPGGNDLGPFMPIEQSALAQLVSDSHRTRLMGWYGLVGAFSVALGSLVGGTLSKLLHTRFGLSLLDSYRGVMFAYAALGLVLALLSTRLSKLVELRAPKKSSSSSRSGSSRSKYKLKTLPWLTLGMPKSRDLVLRFGAVCTIDAFGAGFVLQSVISDWFHVRHHADTAVLGRILFGANLLAGLSSLMAAPLALRIGLLRTMVFTHLPSSIFLLLVPLMPNLQLAVLMLLLRFTISQMDVPTRSSYSVAVCHPTERTTAVGIINIMRMLAASISPLVAGSVLSRFSNTDVHWYVAGCLMIIYDVMLLWNFHSVKPPEEREQEVHVTPDADTLPRPVASSK